MAKGKIKTLGSGLRALLYGASASPKRRGSRHRPESGAGTLEKPTGPYKIGGYTTTGKPIYKKIKTRSGKARGK